MNKAELVAAIAKKTGCTKKAAQEMLEAFTDEVVKSVKKGNDVQLIGFGTFTSIKRSARKMKSPATGKIISVPAKKAPRFKPGKAFKDAVAGIKK